jgi:uncharacterized protein (TIGR03435 family)
MSVRQLILNSYELLAPQLVGGPSWLDDTIPVRLSLDGPPSPDRIRVGMRTLLMDRFKLVMHSETREMDVFALMPVAPGAQPGSAIRTTSVADCRSEPPAGPPPCGAIRLDEGQLVGRAATMAQFVQMLNRIPMMTKLDRLVVDRTGYPGTYTFDWQFAVASRPERADLRQALELAFRLKLESLRAPVQVMVIDRIERPLD